MFSLKPSFTGMRLFVKKDVGERADVGVSSGAQTKRQAEEDVSPKAKAKVGVVPTKVANIEERTQTGSRARSTSKAPLKGEEYIKRATRIREDMAIRSNKSELEKLLVPELRALLEIENIKTFTNAKGSSVNTSSATKPDLVNEIVRHFELIDKAGRGESSSASARTSSVEAGKKKKEKKRKEG